ncbi:MAG: VOC family protein [Terriglobia bacterium]
MNKWWIALLGTLFGVMVASSNSRPKGPGELLARVDHLVYGTPDLDAGIEQLARLMGVRATPGGQHPGRGTRNALIALSPASYLEIIGPDPEQPNPQEPRPFGIDHLKAPRLVAWAAKETDLEYLVSESRRQGVKLGEVLSGSRRRPDGVDLSWRFTDPRTVLADGIVPFFIDWGKTSHPAIIAVKGVTLINLKAEHPDAERVQKTLGALGLDLPVRPGPVPALIATVNSPRGTVELR